LNICVIGVGGESMSEKKIGSTLQQLCNTASGAVGWRGGIGQQSIVTPFKEDACRENWTPKDRSRTGTPETL